MKKYVLLITITSILIFNSCALGGLVEADQLEGTWVSDSSYNTMSNSYYVYYDFNAISVDLNGDQTGNYRIRGYGDTFWWNTNYTPLESGTYTTDFLYGRISLISSTGSSRVLSYSLTDTSLILSDKGWWVSTNIVLRKLN